MNLQPRTDAWAASNAHSTVSYRLQAEAEPDSLCRVLNLFALQFLTPHSVQVSQQDDWLDIEVGIGGLSWHRAEVIAQKLRNLVCVGEVSLSNYHPPQPCGVPVGAGKPAKRPAQAQQNPETLHPY